MFLYLLALEVHPLGRLLALERTGGSVIPYLGYVEVYLEIPGIKSYNEDILLLVISTTTYSEKVPVMVGSKIIDWVMAMMTKGDLARATATWRQAHFGAVMFGSLQLPCTTSQGDGKVGKEATPSPSSNTAASRGFCLDDAGDQFIPPRRRPFPCSRLLASIATQVSGDTACGSMCLLNQHEAPNCLPL